jgi:selenocysteine lyase/cysteine desulfurase
MSLLLLKENVIVSARNDRIRIAPYFYNTKADIMTTLDMIAYLMTAQNNPILTINEKGELLDG